MFSPRNYINLAFILVISDVILNYFLQIYFVRLPILAVVPALLAVYLLFENDQIYRLKAHHVTLLAIGFLGYLLALLTAEGGVPSNRFLEICSAISAWLVGYFWFIQARRRNNVDRWAVVVCVTSAHVLICAVAILKLAPAYFPTYDSIWSLNGVLISRPSVTTDQNFQIFYFLPLAGTFFFARSLLVRLVSLTMLALGAFVLAGLQTRSGIMILAGVALVGVSIQFFSPGGNKKSAVSAVALMAVASIGILIWKGEMLFGLVVRFTETGFDTGYGRLHGMMYFFEKVLIPTWWVPRGYAEYKTLTGGSIPHSNITAQLLDGGILAVIAWFGLVVIPAFRSLKMVLIDGLNRDMAAVCVVAIGSFVAQMSLNVPLVDQIWLWGGATCGAITLAQARRNMPRSQYRKVRFPNYKRASTV